MADQDKKPIILPDNDKKPTTVFHDQPGTSSVSMAQLVGTLSEHEPIVSIVNVRVLVTFPVMLCTSDPVLYYAGVSHPTSCYVSASDPVLHYVSALD